MTPWFRVSQKFDGPDYSIFSVAHLNKEVGGNNPKNFFNSLIPNLWRDTIQQVYLPLNNQNERDQKNYKEDFYLESGVKQVGSFVS